jgi:hypothetical protein
MQTEIGSSGLTKKIRHFLMNSWREQKNVTVNEDPVLSPPEQPVTYLMPEETSTL